MTARQALNESKRLMQGHKMELFVMNLSFIGWYILCMFTFFIPIFYVAPYHNTSIANFYQYVKQVTPPVQKEEPTRWEECKDYIEWFIDGLFE